MIRKLNTSNVDDLYARRNFLNLNQDIESVPFLKGDFRFITFTVAGSGAAQKYAHNLGFIPQDVLLTSAIGGSIIFNYNKFDSQFLNFDATVTTTPLTIRAFIGTYSET